MHITSSSVNTRLQQVQAGETGGTGATTKLALEGGNAHNKQFCEHEIVTSVGR